MPDFDDYGGMGLPGEDVAPVGGGGDPFADAPYADYASAETADLGMMPGGTDAQLTPFSPNGGFDFTDIFRSGAGAQVGSYLAPWMGQATAYPPQPGGAPARGGGGGGGAGTADIVRYVRQSTGLRVTGRSIVNLIVRYGFAAAGKLTGLAMQQLLQLFMQQKGVRHHRRGPGLYTIAKRLRAADRLRSTVSRILGRGGSGGRKRRAPYHHFGKKRSKR